MNRQSNTYTFVYIIVLVLVVGVALAWTATALAPQQQHNADADKIKQILASVHITPDADNVEGDFDHYITEQLVVNSKGEVVGNDAFAIDVADQVKLADDERKLPVYVCDLGAKGKKYILPVYGAGLWGPIWGYVALDADGSTVYGAYFAHQGETPGLGAEIEKTAFANQFENKHMFVDDAFVPVAVVKKGQKPADNREYVNGISGGTITSKGVSAMLDDCLKPYKSFLENLSK